MSRAGPRIITLLAVVAFAALGLAALRSATVIWAYFAYTATIFSLATAFVAIRTRSSYWYGYAVFGVTFFITGFGPWWAVEAGSGAIGQLNPYMPYAGPVRNLVERSVPMPVVPQVDMGAELRIQQAQAALIGEKWQERSSRINNRIVIFHCLLTHAMALAGGVVALGFERSRRMSGPHR